MESVDLFVCKLTQINNFNLMIMKPRLQGFRNCKAVTQFPPGIPSLFAAVKCNQDDRISLSVLPVQLVPISGAEIPYIAKYLIGIDPRLVLDTEYCNNTFCFFPVLYDIVNHGSNTFLTVVYSKRSRIFQFFRLHGFLPI